jgi:hypothetical protein
MALRAEGKQQLRLLCDIAAAVQAVVVDTESLKRRREPEEGRRGGYGMAHSY